MSQEEKRRETKKLADLTLSSRWMYRKSGMDFGPFGSHEILELISKMEINERTQIFEVKTKRWCTIQEVRLFLDHYIRAQKEEEKRRREFALEQETEKVRRTHSARSKAALLLIGSIVFGAAAFLFLYFTYIKQPEETTVLSIFRTPEVRALDSLRVKKIQAAPGPEKTVKQKIVKHAVKKIRNGPANNAPVVEEEMPVMEMDFSSSAGRTISDEDILSVQNKSKAGIIDCFRDEVQRIPDFNGGKVSFLLLPSGKVSSVNIISQNPVSPELLSCTRKSLLRISVEPFDGTFRRFEIPVYIQ